MFSVVKRQNENRTDKTKKKLTNNKNEIYLGKYFQHTYVH